MAERKSSVTIGTQGKQEAIATCGPAESAFALALALALALAGERVTPDGAEVWDFGSKHVGGKRLTASFTAMVRFGSVWDSTILLDS